MTETPPELPPLPDYCWPVDTSCVPDWDATDDTDQPLYSDEAKDRAVSLATQSLRMLTGWRVGGCPVTVRPAAARCREQTYRTYVVAGIGSTAWFPVSLGGTWLNVGCGHSSVCGCLGLREVTLWGAASSVDEVKVDGVTLDVSAYRLDRGGRLVRVDGEDWPLCQNLAAPDTDTGTWSVTYTPGATVDGQGAWAAGVLAGEFVKACTGVECRLPRNVTQVTRQGVVQTISPETFPGGRTGIHEVDAYIERWNPYGHKTPPMVWSPELRRPR